MIKDNLPNNKLKIGSDMGHYGFTINKQSLEIKEDNVSAYVLRKNTNIKTCYFFNIIIHILSSPFFQFFKKRGVKTTSTKTNILTPQIRHLIHLIIRI